MKWTDSDNLVARDAIVHGGPQDGLRVAVAERPAGAFRFPDVFDMSGYRFDPVAWEWVEL